MEPLRRHPYRDPAPPHVEEPELPERDEGVLIAVALVCALACLARLVWIVLSEGRFGSEGTIALMVLVACVCLAGSAWRGRRGS